MADIELLDQALAAIDADPESWDQMCYARRTDCGTAHCVAGHVAKLRGGKPVFLGPAADTSIVEVDGVRWSYSEFARRALRISPEQSGCLFHEANSREDLQAMRDALAEDPDADLGDDIGT